MFPCVATVDGAFVTTMVYTSPLMSDDSGAFVMTLCCTAIDSPCGETGPIGSAISDRTET